MAETDKDDLISIIEEDDKDTKFPNILPLLSVRDVVIFNDMLLPLFVGRKKSVRAVEEAVSKDGFLLIVTQKDPGIENPKPDQIFTIGTVSRILRILKLPDGSIKALVQGIAKARIVKYVLKKSLYRVKIETIVEPPIKKINLEMEALMRNIREHSEKILALRGEMTSDVSAVLESIEDPGKLADLVASNLRLKIDESQILLEIIDPVKRLKKVNDLLAREVELSSVQAKIQSDVRDEISKNQRDYFLREQVRAIHKELGESDEKLEEIKHYQKKIKSARMSKEANKEALKQLKRLEKMYPDSAEASVVRTYLDWMVDMPWSKTTKDVIDIKQAKKVLDKDHFALDKVKDRILEYLSVRKLNPKMKGPILCFVGPPGVGKTSLGQAIAQAMKRKFVRISLGGIRDEAEIRGHRRTYIGALPGRILQGLKQCGTNNPVFMMDEIDKLGSDFRGDPSSALLEALDPEQNLAFSDHYLNLPFDLSKVMFILTANLTDTIPSALLDRMEVITLPGYTEEEKKAIAQRHLIPRQIKENGLKVRNISISPAALYQIIKEYTSEAGLRNLEREIGALFRKVARKIAEGDKGRFHITKNNLQQYLGVAKYYPEMDQERSQVGLSTGLAWTQAGGDVLYVEASLIGGKGELIITGQIGDVMQESARAALSYARASLSMLGVKENVFDNKDIHIHVPAGAIPKDGPSAGIAMATALISVLVNKPVNKDIAMTGEITLRGRVLPIGGLKEKALGAIRGGIRTIIIPEKNKKELAEIPAHIKRKIKFIPVRNMDKVLSLAIEGIVMGNG
ncbi:MAG: endopeptidase La [Deltaproteobacteria bacterium]|nr:endopeptidase La [Deltaproteobacteria bacterium]MBW1958888.1 endopeptidase La [Deltaproteobacteria bacterium]MBW2014541.1 endopeptidase La [Deltaproteobacteria bacterium]MBW2088458.1 endopeptidase La [Deltaproteobacteria bacterium]MBW2319613.1 endopeptidase La [Deltaproteobacteria bacterium]